MAPKQLQTAVISLTVLQVVHVLVPAETSTEESYVGLVGGLVLLIASLAAIYGLRLGRSWAVPLAGMAGVGVGGGFLLYHSVPWKSPLTNPYWNESEIGLVQWLPVIACIVVGAWCAALAFGRRTRPVAA